MDGRPVFIYKGFLDLWLFTSCIWKGIQKEQTSSNTSSLYIVCIYLSTFVHVCLYENISRLNLFLNFLNENTKMNPYKIENSVNTGHPILTVTLNNMKYTRKIQA